MHSTITLIKGDTMKKSALFTLMILAGIFYVQAVFAAESCMDWGGRWNFTYTGSSGQINITEICDNGDGSNPACLPVNSGSPQTYWVCVARGKRQSDNKTIQFRKIAFDTSFYGYYEGSDAEIIEGGGAGAPHDIIPNDNFTATSFTVSDGSSLNLESGIKNGITTSTSTTTVQVSSTTTTPVTTTIQASSTTTTPATTTITEGSTTTTTPATTTTVIIIQLPCPATQILGADNPQLEKLRAFRDSRLAQSAAGRKIIQIYYNNAVSINAALERNPALRAATRRVLEVIAPLVGDKK